MAPQKRKADAYSMRDDFVVSDSGDNDNDDTTSSGPAAKRTKKTTSSSSIIPSASHDNSSTIPEMKKDEEGQEYWEISKARRVMISDYKNKKMISIREYYEKDGKWLPGKKGITMTVDQYSALVTVMPQIESCLSAHGETIPRPRYDGGRPVENGDEEDEDEDDDDADADEDDSAGSESKRKRSTKKSTKKKANIEETSDEDED